ncbi:hypothetical protein JW859_07385 [bacterium]|nr:hypothetical protein [bacterium]
MMKRLGEILLERGVISKSQLEQAMLRQPRMNTFIGQVLIRMGVPMMEIEDALAEQRRLRTGRREGTAV